MIGLCPARPFVPSGCGTDQRRRRIAVSELPAGRRPRGNVGTPKARCSIAIGRYHTVTGRPPFVGQIARSLSAPVRSRDGSVKLWRAWSFEQIEAKEKIGRVVR